MATPDIQCNGGISRMQYRSVVANAKVQHNAERYIEY